jgi:hypothetical protein
MSDRFSPDMPVLMKPEQARDLGRSYKGLADQYAELGMARQSAIAMRSSQWWLAYAIALAAAQTPPPAAD